jgi:hypothetical protein
VTVGVGGADAPYCVTLTIAVNPEIVPMPVNVTVPLRGLEEAFAVAVTSTFVVPLPPPDNEVVIQL